MAITISIRNVGHNAERLIRAAERYQTKAQTKKVIRPAAQKLRDRLKVTVGQTFAGSSRSTGNLRRSIKTFAFPRSRGVHVGPRIGGTAKRGLADGYYFGWHELGTKRGIRAKFMMQQTIERHGSEARRIMISSLLNDLRHLV